MKRKFDSAAAAGKPAPAGKPSGRGKSPAPAAGRATAAPAAPTSARSGGKPASAHGAGAGAHTGARAQGHKAPAAGAPAAAGAAAGGAATSTHKSSAGSAAATTTAVKPVSVAPIFTPISASATPTTAFPRGGRHAAKEAAAAHKDSNVEEKEEFLFSKARTATPAKGQADTHKQSKKGDKAKGKTDKKGKHSKTDDDEDSKGHRKTAVVLSFKKLTPGLQLMGMIRAVSDASLIISLPHNLTGIVRRPEISSKFAHSAVDLRELYSVGEYVRCAVIHTEDDGSTRHVDLSLKPERLNFGFTMDSMTAGTLVQISIESREDHGFVVELGLSGIRAFMPFSNTDNNGEDLAEGQSLLAVVTASQKSASSVTVATASAPLTAALQKPAPKTASLGLTEIKPGLLINGKILKVLTNGILVNFLGAFAGTVDIFHLRAPAVGSWKNDYPFNSNVRCRVIHVDIATKTIALSMAPHIVQLRLPQCALSYGALCAATVLRLDPGKGMLVGLAAAPTPAPASDSKAEDSDSDAEATPAAEADEDANDYADADDSSKSDDNAWATTGYVHISRAADGHLDHLERKFKVGATVTGRVLGMTPMDGITNVSLQPSVVEAQFLRYDEVQPGMVVTAIVKKITDKYLVLALSEHVNALCTTLHMGDARVRNPEKKFKLESKVQCRVLEVDPVHHKVNVTLKPSLVTSELPVVNAFPGDAAAADTTVGINSVVHGFVTLVKASGVVVTFYNNVHGLIPTAEIKNDLRADPVSAFPVGKVLKVRIVRANAGRNTITLSLRLTPRASPVASSIGLIVSGKVVNNAKPSKNGMLAELKLTMPDGTPNVTGILPEAHFSDHPRLCAALRKATAVGTELPQLRILRILHTGDDGQCRVLVTAKPLLLAAPAAALPAKLADLSIGAKVVGYIANITAFGVFVRCAEALTGVAFRHELADTFVADPQRLFVLGQSVVASVLSIDTERGKFAVTLKPSVVDAGKAVVDTDQFLASLLEQEEQAGPIEAADDSDSDSDDSDAEADADADADGDVETKSDSAAPTVTVSRKQFPTGAVVKATVDSIKPYGVILSLPEGVIGFCDMAHLGETPVKPGAAVKARVLDADPSSNMVQVSLQSHLVEAAASKKKSKAARLPADSTVSAVVEVVRDGRYAVVSLPEHDHRMGIAAITHYNHAEACLTTADVGKTISAVVINPDHNGTVYLRAVVDAKTAERKPKQSRKRSDSIVDFSTLAPGSIVNTRVVKHVADAPEAHLEIVRSTVRHHARLAVAEMLELDINSGMAASASKVVPQLTAGSVMAAKIVSITTREHTSKSKTGLKWTTYHIQLTTRKADMALPDGELASTRPAWKNSTLTADAAHPLSVTSAGVKAGAISWGIVELADADGITVGFGNGVRAQVPVLELGSTAAEITSARTRLTRGQPAHVLLTDVHGSKAHGTLRIDNSVVTAAVKAFRSAGKSSDAQVAADAATAALAVSTKHLQAVHSNATAVGVRTVGKVLPPHGKLWATVQLGHGRIASVCITQLADRAEWVEDPVSKLTEGSIVDAVFITAAKAGGAPNLSLRPSLIALAASSSASASAIQSAASKVSAALDADAEPVAVAGSIVTAYVTNATTKGVFLRPAFQKEARVMLLNLSDGFVKDVPQAFPVGKLVAGRVTAVDATTGHIDMNLRPSVVTGGASRLQFTDLEPGQQYTGRVAVLQTYGVFVELLVPSKGAAQPQRKGKSDVPAGFQATGIRGLVHKSETGVKDHSTAFNVGDQVRVVVLRVDTEAKRCGLSMKPSHFLPGAVKPTAAAAAEDSDEESEGSESSDSDVDMEEGPSVAEALRAAGVDARIIDSDEDGDDVDMDGEEDGSATESATESESEDEEDEPAPAPAPAKKARGGKAPRDSDDEDHETNAGTAGPVLAVSAGFSWDTGLTGTAGADSDSESAGSDDEQPQTKLSKRAKAAAKKREEQDLVQRERDLVAGDVLPETDDDFERLLVAEPNNSFLWIKYMAFQLSRTEFDKARSIGRRALESIHFRDEQEKLNIWVALLNLEHQYGTPALLAEVFKQALAHNDPKAVHMQMLAMYERTNHHDEAEALFKITQKKFPESQKVWLKWIQYRFKVGDVTGARTLLADALKALPKRKHLTVISQFAILEFKQGSVERGRTMFEGIASSYPKRVDMWNVYLDQEIAGGHYDAARRLFQRVTNLKFSSKKMKFLFKKFLAFEQEHGTEQTVQAVADAARAYVESVVADA